MAINDDKLITVAVNNCVSLLIFIFVPIYFAICSFNYKRFLTDVNKVYFIGYNVLMLQLSRSLLSKPVLSLRTGSAVAQVTGAIFNPNNLKIEGFYCRDSYSKKELILLYQDIRDVLATGFVVNDHDVLVEEGDLVRLKDILSINYQIVGKQVVTVDKQKIGKVSDFATEVETEVR